MIANNVITPITNVMNPAADFLSIVENKVIVFAVTVKAQTRASAYLTGLSCYVTLDTPSLL